jgi:hypothetical protein
MSVDSALVRLERNALHGIQELRPCEYAARLPRHRRQQLKFSFGQVDATLSESRFHAGHIELDVTDPDDI